MQSCKEKCFYEFEFRMVSPSITARTTQMRSRFQNLIGITSTVIGSEQSILFRAKNSDH